MSQGFAKSVIGITGAMGPTGSIGPTGMPGVTGPQGATGVQGTVMNSGMTTINFGSVPGANIVGTAVTGQTNILTTSTVSCFMMGDTTDNGSGVGHNAGEHQWIPLKLTAGNLIAGTGFTIYAESEYRLTATFIVRWFWTQ